MPAPLLLSPAMPPTPERVTKATIKGDLRAIKNDLRAIKSAVKKLAGKDKSHVDSPPSYEKSSSDEKSPSDEKPPSYDNIQSAGERQALRRKDRMKSEHLALALLSNK